MKALLFLAILCLAFGSIAKAEDVVWSGLVYATNEETPQPVPRQLAGFSEKLRNVFGYNQLELLSEHREVMDDDKERWLLPGNGFCLKVDTRKNPGRGYLMNMQLFQDKRVLVQTEARLARKCPIFFRGPLCANGQLIIVLLIE
ncbi:MAG: hypothetical protein WCP06_04895 [Verrucomicrobiota bacterium]